MNIVEGLLDRGCWSVKHYLGPLHTSVHCLLYQVIWFPLKKKEFLLNKYIFIMVNIMLLEMFPTEKEGADVRALIFWQFIFRLQILRS